MKHLFVLITFFISMNSYAKPVVEIWQCQESEYGDWSKILVTATVNESRESGKIFVAGVIQESTFGIKGFNRRWNFGLAEDSTYDFAFIIKPNGDASYYDFSLEKQTKPSMYLFCRETE